MNHHDRSIPVAELDAYNAQVALEEECLATGAARYWAELDAAGNGPLPPGQQLMRAALVPTAAAIEQWITEAKAGMASRSAGVVLFIDQLSPQALAFITARSIISRLHERPTVVNLAGSLARALEESTTIDEMAKTAPRLAEKVAKQVERYQDKNRVVFVRKGAALAGTKVIQWDDSTRVRVGTVLIHLFEQATGLIGLDTLYSGGKTKFVVRASESCRQWLEESHARCALLSPVWMPMTVKPRNWTTPFNGGYLTHNLRRPLMKTRNRGVLSELANWDMPRVYEAVNTLQATRWAVNTDILGVVKTLWETGRGVALPSRDPEPLPAKSWAEGEEPSEDTLKEWKARAAQVYDANAKLETKRIRVVQALWVADKMVEAGNRVHFVYNLDWRGRVYPAATGLNPQGDDLQKALLRFGTSKPLGEEGAFWLAVHGANSFGVDKVSFDDRCAWVQEHEEMILSCAADPLGDTRWADADAPWAFLAFCQEWAKLDQWVQHSPQWEFPSSLPVSFDGACNGLQNFSAMLRDEVGGAATGLVPGERPADIYSAVAAKAQAISDASGSDLAPLWVGKWTRNLAKRNTMTVPYGVSQFGMRDQIRGTFGEAKRDGNPAGWDLSFESAAHVAACNYEAIGQVVVAARRAMDWLQEAAKVAARGGLPVRWTAPSGLLVVQDYRTPVGQELDFTVSGRRYRLTVERTGDKLASKKQALGISPNFVHSLDASHLVATVLRAVEYGVTGFAMVHDSFGTHAGDAAVLRDALREAFIEQYRADVLGQFRDQLVGQLPEDLAAELPPLPAFGTLDLEQVRHSDYFFA